MLAVYLKQIERWPILNEVEMPELPWYTIQEDIQKHRNVGMLCRFHVQPVHPPQEGPEDTIFTIVREASASSL